MAITVFRVYWATAEMKFSIKNGFQYRPDINPETVSDALTNDPDPNLMATFELEDEAEEYIKEHYPVIHIDPPSGVAVKFIRVSGYYVQEEEIEIDEDGDVTDCYSIGTGYMSEFPADYK